MTNSQERQLLQLALFEEYRAVPSWCDLDEATREEVIRYLAQLLGSVLDGNAGALQIWGGQDE